MKSHYLVSLFLILSIASIGAGQKNYSESAEYKPRQDVKTKKELKEEKKKSATGQTPLDGEITVTIPVTVLDKSAAAISGITRQDVSIFVDDAEVPIFSFEGDSPPATMILVLDSSPSARLRFEKMQQQASQLVASLPSNMKVMVIDFHEKLNVRSQPTTDRAETLKAISKIDMGGGTSLYSAIDFIYTSLLPQISGRKIIVLMTDGVDTLSRKATFASSLTTAEKNDVSIYPVYFDTFEDPSRTNPNDAWIRQILQNSNIKTPGSSADEYRRGLLYLQDLTRATGGRMFSSEKLEAGTRSLLGELANRYYVTIKLPRKNVGSRPVRVRVNRPSLAVFARGSFVEN